MMSINNNGMKRWLRYCTNIFDQTNRKGLIRDPILRDDIVGMTCCPCGTMNENDDTKNDTVYHHPPTNVAIMTMMIPSYKDDVDADEEHQQQR